MIYNEKVIYISKLCNVFAAAIFDSHSCAAKDLLLLLLLLLLWQMMEKLSHHHSGIPVESDGVLEHLFWLVLSLGQCSKCSSSMVEFGIWHTVHSLD